MALAIDGLASGLDTTSLINSLMQLEAIPQSLLKNKVSSTQAMVSALQSLNSKVATLTDVAAQAAKQDSLELYSATSSSSALTATAGTGASAGSIDLSVDQLAQSQVIVTAQMQVWPSVPPVLTIVDANGIHTEITAASDSIDDMVSAVNGAGAGVTAVKVASGTDPGTGEQQYRLQFTATDSGLDGAVTLYQGTSAEVTAGTATDLLDAGATQIRAAQDAEITLWAGSPVAQTITSSTNSFSAILPGVDVTVVEASTTPVTVTVARDTARAAQVAEDLVSALNAVFSYIATNSAVTTSTSSGASAARGGLFTGDSTVRDVNQKLLSAASLPVDGRSPTEIGIELTREGKFEFDEAVFTEALAEDPAFVAQVLQQIGERVQEAASDASDKYDGLITSKITGQESLVSNMSTQIQDWDRRLATRRSTLERTYAALEVQLSAMQSQSAWLSSQLGTLPKVGD